MKRHYAVKLIKLSRDAVTARLVRITVCVSACGQAVLRCFMIRNQLYCLATAEPCGHCSLPLLPYTTAHSVLYNEACRVLLTS